jgi:hypothetical protein
VIVGITGARAPTQRLKRLHEHVSLMYRAQDTGSTATNEGHAKLPQPVGTAHAALRFRRPVVSRGFASPFEHMSVPAP